MSDTFTSLDLEAFGVVAGAVPAFQPITLSAAPSNTACAEDDSAGVPLDFEVRQSGQSFYCVIS